MIYLAVRIFYKAFSLSQYSPFPLRTPYWFPRFSFLFSFTLQSLSSKIFPVMNTAKKQSCKKHASIPDSFRNAVEVHCLNLDQYKNEEAYVTLYHILYPNSCPQDFDETHAALWSCCYATSIMIISVNWWRYTFLMLSISRATPTGVVFTTLSAKRLEEIALIWSCLIIFTSTVLYIC